MSGVLECLANFANMRIVGHFHGYHTDAILARKFEYPRQTTGAVSLEGIGAGTRLVGTHARTLLAVVGKSAHHGFNVGLVIHSAQAGKDMQRLLVETHPVITEACVAYVPSMAADHAIVTRNPYDFLDPSQAFNLGLVQRCDVTDHVDLGQRAAGTGNAVGAGRNA